MLGRALAMLLQSQISCVSMVGHGWSQASSMESRKQRPPALQLPSDSDGPLATLVDSLEEGGSGKKSSERTIPAERPPDDRPASCCSRCGAARLLRLSSAPLSHVRPIHC